MIKKLYLNQTIILTRKLKMENEKYRAKKKFLILNLVYRKKLRKIVKMMGKQNKSNNNRFK